MKRLAPFIGFITLMVMDLLQNGMVDGSILDFLRHI
jgi:hypothetical protein